MPKARVVFVRRDCGFCKMYLRIIQEFNFQLAPENRIASYDVTDAEDRGFDDPFIKKYLYDGTPTLFFDGIKIVGATTREYIKETIYQLVKKELIN